MEILLFCEKGVDPYSVKNLNVFISLTQCSELC